MKRPCTMNRRIEFNAVHKKLRLGARRIPHSVARCHAQMKPTRMLEPLVVIFEARNHFLDAIANQRIVVRVREPVNLGAAERGQRHARDNRNLGQQIRRSRAVHAVRNVHHAHGVFHAHALRHAVLRVDFSAAERGQDQRVAAMNQVAAVQLGRDMHGQVARTHRFPYAWRIGGRNRKIAAQPDEHFELAGKHCFD